MTPENFEFLVAQLKEAATQTVIKIALVNEVVETMFEDLPQAETPIGINGLEVMTYDRLADDHVLFFSSREDATEFITACEDCIKESPESDPNALVGAVIEICKQRLIRNNNRIDKVLHGKNP